MNSIIRNAHLNDLDALLALYRKVAAIEGGLARKKDEVTHVYITSFLEKSLHHGLIYVAAAEGTSNVIGEIHCYSPAIQVFSHVLSDLTIAVDPDHQGKGIGRMLFTKLLSTVINERPDILRIELIARESNAQAISFYESLGFKSEGRFIDRIQSVGGGFEADIPMAWVRGREERG